MCPELHSETHFYKNCETNAGPGCLKNSKLFPANRTLPSSMSLPVIPPSEVMKAGE